MNLNLYRKKAALDRALNGKAVSGQKFEVFAIHSRGYFTRDPLCTDHLHETILDACVCANIKSARQDMEKYGVEVEIVQISGTTDFFKNKNLQVITKKQIQRAFEKVTTPATLLYRLPSTVMALACIPTAQWNAGNRSSHLRRCLCYRQRIFALRHLLKRNWRCHLLRYSLLRASANSRS